MHEERIERDKRMGVPSFKGWEEREVKAACKCTWPSCNKLPNCRNR